MLSDLNGRRIIELIARAGLPTGGLKPPTDAVLQAMRSDKKIRDAKFRFVLPDRIGHVVIRDDVPESLVRDVIETLR
jgi:3-dehydroquinate synthase